MSIKNSSDKPFYQRLLNRFSSYSFVGMGTFLMDLFLIWFFIVLFNITEPISIGVAFFIAVHINYLILRFWVYRHSTEKTPQTYAYFISLATLTAITIPFLVIWFETSFGWNILTSRIIVASIIGTIGFLFNTFVNFKFL